MGLYFYNFDYAMLSIKLRLHYLFFVIVYSFWKQIYYLCGFGWVFCMCKLYSLKHAVVLYHPVMWNCVAAFLELVLTLSTYTYTYCPSFVGWLWLSIFSCSVLEYFNVKFVIKKGYRICGIWCKNLLQTNKIPSF